MAKSSLPADVLSRLPVQERSQQTVRGILQATLSLLEREGVEGLTTNRVAEEAGLSVASLYRFFPNKQAVIYAAYSEWIEELFDQVAAVVEQWRPVLADAPDRWREAANAIADILSESRRGTRVEYELLRAMFSHRELQARDSQHMDALADCVAGLMRLAGANGSDAEIRSLAAFANEQFTLATEIGGDRPPEQRARLVGLARAAFLALWSHALTDGKARE